MSLCTTLQRQEHCLVNMSCLKCLWHDVIQTNHLGRRVCALRPRFLLIKSQEFFLAVETAARGPEKLESIQMIKWVDSNDETNRLKRFWESIGLRGGIRRCKEIVIIRRWLDSINFEGRLYAFVWEESLRLILSEIAQRVRNAVRYAKQPRRWAKVERFESSLSRRTFLISLIVNKMAAVRDE